MQYSSIGTVLYTERYMQYSSIGTVLYTERYMQYSSIYRYSTVH